MDPDDEIDRLWREHAPAVHRYARRRFPPDEIDEVVAETFCVACRRTHCRGCWGVARRVTANLTRGERRRRLLVDRLAGQPERAAGEHGSSDDAVAAALRSLSDADRELLTLVAWDGLTPARAAAALGCSPGAFKVTPAPSPRSSSRTPRARAVVTRARPLFRRRWGCGVITDRELDSLPHRSDPATEDDPPTWPVRGSCFTSASSAGSCARPGRAAPRSSRPQLSSSPPCPSRSGPCCPTTRAWSRPRWRRTVRSTAAGASPHPSPRPTRRCGCCRRCCPPAGRPR